MGTCFVIQPFDNGAFDKRFKDVIAPAIEDAGLVPYRVDRDPSVSIPMDDIENGIKTSDICISEITTDNPNVWYELGFAIASQKPVVLLCSDERKTPFPFDVGHRHVTKYKTESQSDFEKLKTEITTRINAILEKRERLELVSMTSPIANTEGLAQHEMAALVTVAENMDSLEAPGGWVEIYKIRQDMDNAGFNKIAITLGLGKLTDEGLIECCAQMPTDGYNQELTSGYMVTNKGMDWLQNNKDKLNLKKLEDENHYSGGVL